MGQSYLEVPLRHVAWRTCGSYWDYTFLLTPVCDELREFKDWYTLVEYKLPQGMSEGQLLVGDKTVKFVAAVWRDEKRKDSFGRSVQQKLIWFVGVGGKDSVAQRDLPMDWANQIVVILQSQPCFRKLNSMSKQKVRTVSPGAYFREKFSLEIAEIRCNNRRKLEKVSNIGVISILEREAPSKKEENAGGGAMEVLTNIRGVAINVVGSLMKIICQYFRHIRG